MVWSGHVWSCLPACLPACSLGQTRHQAPDSRLPVPISTFVPVRPASQQPASPLTLSSPLAQSPASSPKFQSLSPPRHQVVSPNLRLPVPPPRVASHLPRIRSIAIDSLQTPVLYYWTRFYPAHPSLDWIAVCTSFFFPCSSLVSSLLFSSLVSVFHTAFFNLCYFCHRRRLFVTPDAEREGGKEDKGHSYNHQTYYWVFFFFPFASRTAGI